MKTLFVYIIGLFVSEYIYAQDLSMDSVSGKIIYQATIEVKGASKEMLYSNAKRWILKTLKPDSKSIALRDASSDSITSIGKFGIDRVGSYNYIYYDDGILNFELCTQFRLGEFKYAFENFTYSANMFYMGNRSQKFQTKLEDLNSSPNAITESAFSQINSQIKAFATSLVAAVSKKKKHR